MIRTVLLTGLVGATAAAVWPHATAPVGADVATAALDSIASPAAPGSTTPNLTTGPDGRVYMSWLEPNADSTHSFRFAVFDGTRWTPARTIVKSREFVVNWADFASIAVLGNRQIAAHWLQRGTGSGAYGVRVAMSRDDGATWSAPMTPHHDDSATEHGFVAMWEEPIRPTLRAVTSNSIGAVWLDGRRYARGGAESTNEMMLLTTIVSATNAGSAEIRLDERVCDCCQTSAAVTRDGPIIAYRDRSPDEIRDISVIRRVNNRWLAPQPVSKDNWKIAACPVNGPAVDAAGARVALAWFTGARDTARVKVAFSNDAGATFSAPVVVDGGNPAGRVDVRLLPDGGALVTWIERTGGDAAAVRVRRIAANGRAGTPVTVASSSAARASGFPRMALMRDHVIFAWTVPGRPSAVRVARLPLTELR